MSTQLFIVTGASGRLGEAYIEALKKDGKEVIGISRKPISSKADKVIQLDLLDRVQTKPVIQEIDLSGYTKIYLIHTVGKFKFEKGQEVLDNDKDGIDDEVYATNVLTLKNLIEPLLISVKNQKVIICAFASVSDRHDVPYWKSYTHSKNILRKYLQMLYDFEKISAALMVNVSTIDTGNENTLRPFADKTYWLKSEEIVSKSLPVLESLQAYAEIDVIKEKPNFDEKYYSDHSAILEKWHREMGI